MAKHEILAVKISATARPSLLDLFRRSPERGLVTYTAAPLSPHAQPHELRRDPRRRTRLRAGKVLDRANRFLVDAAIVDRSREGLRLRLARDCAVPETFHLFDEESDLIFAARVMWRRQATLGVRLRPGGPVAATPRQIAALRGKFYAMKD